MLSVLLSVLLGAVLGFLIIIARLVFTVNEALERILPLLELEDCGMEPDEPEEPRDGPR